MLSEDRLDHDANTVFVARAAGVAGPDAEDVSVFLSGALQTLSQVLCAGNPSHARQDAHALA